MAPRNPDHPHYYRTWHRLCRTVTWLNRAATAAPLAAPVAVYALGGPLTVALAAAVAAPLTLAAATLTLAWAAGRLLARLDADLDAVPERDVRDLASLLYVRYCADWHCPANFERSARLWLARGHFQLPRGAALRPHTTPLTLPTPAPRNGGTV